VGERERERGREREGERDRLQQQLMGWEAEKRCYV